MLRISVFIFLFFGIISIFITFIPLYYQEQGLTKTEIGLVLGVGSLISIFSQPFWGMISDRRNTVKKVIIFLLAASLIVSIGIFKITALGLLLLTYSMYNLFFTAIPALTDSLAVSTAEQQGGSFGFIRMWGDLGLGTFSLVMGFVIAWIGMDYLWWIYAVIVILTIIAATTLRDAQIRTVALTKESFVRLFTNPSFLWFMFLILLIGTPHRMNDVLVGIFMTSMGGTEAQVGQAWMVATFSSAPLFILAGLLLRKFHALFLLALASLLYAIRWGIYGLIDNPDLLIILQISQGLTFPLFYVVAVYHVTQIVPPELRSTGQSTFAAVFGGVAGMIGSYGGGFIMDAFEPHTAYQFGMVFSLVAAIVTAITWIRVRKQA